MQLLRDLREDANVHIACSGKLPIKVMVIEDDPEDLFFIVNTLQSVGCVVSPFQNGITALNEIRTNPLGYCIIFVDLNLPGIDGVELLRQAHILSPETHFIIVTGSDRVCEIQKDCYYGVVRKPFHFKTATEIMAKLTLQRV